MNWIRSGILIAFGVGLLMLAIWRLRRYQLKERYALLFVLLGLPFLILAVWPNLIEVWANRLQMNYGTLMLLCVSAFLFLIVFELLTIVSQQDRKIATLSQMVGILMQRQDQPQQKATTEAQASQVPETREARPDRQLAESAAALQALNDALPGREPSRSPKRVPASRPAERVGTGR